MAQQIVEAAELCLARLRNVLRQPESMAFLPAVTLAAFWLGGERVLAMTALGLPLVYMAFGAFRSARQDGCDPRIDNVTGLTLRSTALAQLRRWSAAAERGTGGEPACVVLQLDALDEIVERHGFAGRTEVLRRTGERLVASLRGTDTIARLEGEAFAIALAPTGRAELESLIQIAARLQAAVGQPISLDGARAFVTASVGFCALGRLPRPSAEALLEAAEAAATEAVRNGPGAIRAWSPELARQRSDRSQLRTEIEAALDRGQVIPYFQPQISTDTGAISGFEVLARWQHPQRGLIRPAEFLPLIEEAGLSARLSQVMLGQALSALAAWDASGLAVPAVSVNFARHELADPQLPDRLAWELDRFDLAPRRLTVEILESVAAETESDVVIGNLTRISAMGCGIDLDDFGTGQASIANIRRFRVRRIKIDRCFITHVDEDQGQQQVVGAILSLAERLGVDTLAEGVETPGEHTMLAQLGCGHVQGFGIARPMPFDDTAAWVARHRGRQASLPRIGSKAG